MRNLKEAMRKLFPRFITKKTKFNQDIFFSDLLHLLGYIPFIFFSSFEIIIHMFQPSRFERENPVLRGCLPSSRLISKSPVLRETSPNFHFFLKIPICIASCFVFWCFNCVTAIGSAKNTL